MTTTIGIPFAPAGVQDGLATKTCPVNRCGQVFSGTDHKKAGRAYAEHYEERHRAERVECRDMRTGRVTVIHVPPTVIVPGEYEAKVAKLRAEAARLPLDLDGDRYRVYDRLGAWKVTACCGCPVTGTDSGIVCKGCYEDRGDFPDGPARLKPSDPKVLPASQTAVRVTL